MKLSILLDKLQAMAKEYGDIDVQLQDDNKDGKGVMGHPSFFVVADEYDDNEVVCNLRWWPY